MFLNTDELVFFLLDYIMNNFGLFIFVYFDFVSGIRLVW